MLFKYDILRPNDFVWVTNFTAVSPRRRQHHQFVLKNLNGRSENFQTFQTVVFNGIFTDRMRCLQTPIHH